MKCSYCELDFISNVKCVWGHYICDDCHAYDAVEVIRNVCLSTKSVNPVLIAQRLFEHPSVKMHGPEHHYLVPAALLAAAKNTDGDSMNLKQALKVAEHRSANILGGFCGFYGCCGAAIGTGIFISAYTQATPLSKEGWSNANLMTSKSLEKIARLGGPRCCKRDTLLAIETAIDFFEEKYHVQLEKEEKIHCSHSDQNKECITVNCPYFNH